MRSTTLTPVFWNPGKSFSYPSGYQTEIEQFLADVAADSGMETNFFSVLTQYYELAGGKTNHVSYSATTGSALEDEKALPAGGSGERCTSPFVSHSCVSDKGVRVELKSLIKSEGLSTGTGHEYIVFFPPGLDSCFGETTPEGGLICSGNFYCGYHGALNPTTPEEVQYANEPDNADPEYKGGCMATSGLGDAYATTDSASHEISESVTDPYVGSLIAGKEILSWYDEEELVEPGFESEYGEIGDMCAYEFKQGDPALIAFSEEGFNDVPLSKSNQTINGHQYLLQLEWDNSHSTCSLSAQAATTKATFTDTASPGMHTGESISFDGTGSHGPADPHISNTIKTYEWNWGDGTKTSSGSPTVEHTYTSSQGEPVKTFTVTLTVIDKNGDEGSTTRTVKIEDRPPTATFASPAGATTGAPTQFESTGSSDPDGTIAVYEWSFGDGAATTGPLPTHVYTSPGEYTVKLKVTDDAGNTAEISHAVTVAPAPPAKTSGTNSGETGKGGTPGNVIHVTGVKQNRKKGTAAIGVTVPGAGVLSAREASSAHSSLVAPLVGALVAPTAYPVALVAAAKGKAKPKGPFVKSVSMTVSAAGNVTIQIVPNAAGSALLKRKHKLALKILIAFTPTGGTQGTLVQPVTLVLSAAKKHK
jgi:PKD repeat protein